MAIVANIHCIIFSVPPISMENGYHNVKSLLEYIGTYRISVEK